MKMISTKGTKQLKLIITAVALGILGCNTHKKEPNSTQTYPDIHIVGAMKNVMWRGQLGSSINLDTMTNKKGLYGLGPESYLTGELLINNGESYVSKVTSDTTMVVSKSFATSAPFFVFANINEWNNIELPSNIKTIPDLEKFIVENASNYKQPFAFKLSGLVSKAVIHIQNLPEDTEVSSPEGAHLGQTNYELNNKASEIIGFFSKQHQGIFTHHDSYLHMHLITVDETKMGHLDSLEIKKMTLYLPKK